MYTPGDLTDENDRLESYKLLKSQSKQEYGGKTSGCGFPQYKNDVPIPQKQISRDSGIDGESLHSRSDDLHSLPSQTRQQRDNSQKKDSNDALKSRQESCDSVLEDKPQTVSSTDMSYCKEHNARKQNAEDVKAYLDTISNFHLARELHKVNLEHEPLPDTVPDALFKKLQMQEPKKHPGLAIKGNSFASAIGWKGYKGFGANKCTKMKIFRPKTSEDAMRKPEDPNRPSSVNSFDMKWRFIRQNKVLPIDLAICWDMTPNNPSDEPKRTKHIDGSNGSQAPAVFSMVQTPKADGDNDRNEPTSGRNLPALFTRVEQHEDIRKVGDEPMDVRPKTTSHAYHGKQPDLSRAKSAYNLRDHSKNSTPPRNTSTKSKQSYQSTPNISACNKLCCDRIFNSRLCVACELRNLPEKTPPKEEYKMAFKAGKPNNSRSSSSNSSGTLKVPKQKDPYSRRNYAIKSLSPPFCLQKDKREEYPDHWRLASVYQHSYKPIHMRKKTLLQSVYQ